MGRRETQAQIKEVGRLKRLRDRLMREMDNPIYGGRLGVAFMGGWITEDQHIAGSLWGQLERKHAALMGIKLTPDAPSGERIIRANGPAPDAPPAVIKSIRNDFDQARDRVMAVHRQAPVDLRLMCVLEESPRDMGIARAGLAALVQHWNLTGGGRERRQRILIERWA